MSRPIFVELLADGSGCVNLLLEIGEVVGLVWLEGQKPVSSPGDLGPGGPLVTIKICPESALSLSADRVSR